MRNRGTRHWNRAIHLAGALCMAMMLATPAQADVKAGIDAWGRGDYTAAVAEWQGPAEQGDADAQFNLGEAYRRGRGVPRDLAQAELLFGKAAAQGHIHAADNYGLLMFDRGERAQAMPYIRAAADRGDARAQYLLGIAHFNGDLVAKDWVRAYALMTLAQSAGLPQAVPAMAQMDEHIPLAQRQAAASLAAQLQQQADANRASLLAANDLGARMVGPQPATVRSPAAPAATAAPTSPVHASPVQAGPVHTSPALTAPAAVPSPTLPVAKPAAPAVVKPAPKAPAQPRPAPAPAVAGNWRIQLGAFGVAANADALWARIKARPEVAGHPRINAKAGAVTKLQAGGYSREAANRACAALSAAGFSCLPAQD